MTNAEVHNMVRLATRVTDATTEQVIKGGITRDTVAKAFKCFGKEHSGGPSLVILNTNTAKDVCRFGKGEVSMEVGAQWTAATALWAVVESGNVVPGNVVPDDVFLLFAEPFSLITILAKNLMFGEYTTPVSSVVKRVRFSQECPTEEEKK